MIKLIKFLHNCLDGKNLSSDECYEKLSYGIKVKTVYKKSVLKESILLLDPRIPSMLMFIDRKINKIRRLKIHDITQISFDQERSGIANQSNFLSIFLREENYNIIFERISDLNALLFILSDGLSINEKEE